MTFLFDENLPRLLAIPLNAYGKRLPRKLYFRRLERSQLSSSDPYVLELAEKEKAVLLTADVAMISEHDLAALVQHRQLKVAILQANVANANGWDFAHWCFARLEEVAESMESVAFGTVCMVTADGSIRVVPPGSPRERRIKAAYQKRPGSARRKRKKQEETLSLDG